MFSLTTLARPLLRSTSAAKKVAQNSAKAPSNRRPLKASFAKRNASRDYFRRYCTSHAQASDAPPTIVTVDKLGVQRDASEMQQPQQAKTSYTHGAPAAEMPIFEVTRLNFQETLASQSPVIIMAYMPGNELSTRLGESLTRRVMDLGGSVRLGRLNASVEQELAAALKLTQLPTTLGVFGGRMVNSFVGVPEDSVLDEFTDLMLRVGGHNQLVELATMANGSLERGEIAEARTIFQDILSNSQLRAEAIALAGLIRCAVQEGKVEEAQELAAVIRESYPKDAHAPEILQAFTALELASNSSAASGVSIDDLKQKVAADANDLDARLQLATALWGASQQANAINELLAMIKIDKHWNDQAARKLLLKFWETLGPEHALVSSSRKRFGMIWF